MALVGSRLGNSTGQVLTETCTWTGPICGLCGSYGRSRIEGMDGARKMSSRQSATERESEKHPTNPN